MFSNIVIPAGLVGTWSESKRRRGFLHYAAEPMTFHTRITGIEYEDEYCKLDKHGRLIVKRFCPSDGCTPKWLILNLFYFGVPDGPIDSHTRLPVTYRAFYVHDVLLYIVQKLKIDGLFVAIHREFCREIHRAPWRKEYKMIYCQVVKRLGPKRLRK